MEKERINNIEIVLIGGSAGSIDVLLKVIPALKNISYTLLIILHRKSSADSSLLDLLTSKTGLKVREIEDKEKIVQGVIYLAPPDYHLLLEREKYFSLDVSEKINFSRPSIDVTFESAAEIYSDKLCGILLSGANNDGTDGLNAIAQKGGFTIVQDPATAEVPVMPANAIANAKVDQILSVEEIILFLNEPGKMNQEPGTKSQDIN